MASPQQTQWREVQQVLDASGQPIQTVPFAQYVVNIGAVQGGALNLAAPGQQAADRVRPRRDAPRVLPRPVRGFLDREPEQAQVGQALARRQPVDVSGPDGAGKTALISQALHGQLPSAFPDGTVYVRAKGEAYDDLLQDLLKQFYDAGRDPVRFTENEVRGHLAEKQALVAVDDADELDEDEAAALLDVVPQSALLLAGRELKLLQGAGLSLGGLPREQAVALFARAYGQDAAPDRPTVEAICQALDDVPKAILKTARMAAQRQVALDQVLDEVRPRPERRDPLGQTTWMLGFHLSEGERRTLAGLAAPGGPTVGFEALAYVTQIDEDKLREYLNRLQKMELAHAVDGRYALDEGLLPHVQQLGVDEAMQTRAAQFFLRQARELRPRSKDPDEDNVLAALDFFFQRRRWGEVIDIARATDRYLATAGRWGQWRRVLERALHAARQSGDRAAEAWAQNQLGIVAVGAGSAAVAEGFFRGALSIWQALGDRQGATIARWNLQMLIAPPPPPGEGQPEGQPGGGSSLPAILGGAAAVLVVTLGILIAVAVWPDRPTPPPPPPPATTRVPPTTVAPPPTVVPEIDLGLAAGCGEVFEPGQNLVIRLWSSVDGTVAVSWPSPNGQREFLFNAEVEAGETFSQDWDAPEAEGRWVLAADLNDGQAEDECAFSVAFELEPPVIESVWVPPNEAEVTCPGDQLVAYAQVLDDSSLSRVELASRPPDGFWFSTGMEAIDDETYSAPLTVHEEPGTEFYVYAEDVYGNSSTSPLQAYAVEPCPTILYDFVEMAPKAEWTGTTPEYPYAYYLSFPGQTNDERGFALWQYDATLEDGSRPDHRILETHPTWTSEGGIQGRYSLYEPVNVVIQEGDRFVARVGFLSGAGAGDATFSLRWRTNDPDASSVALGELRDDYDGAVQHWVIPLDEIAGNSGYFYLRVEAGETAAQDWAVWVEARIERP